MDSKLYRLSNYGGYLNLHAKLNNVDIDVAIDIDSHGMAILNKLDYYTIRDLFNSDYIYIDKNVALDMIVNYSESELLNLLRK